MTKINIQKIEKLLARETIYSEELEDYLGGFKANPTELTHKKGSRCFVEKEQDILKVEAILKSISDFEFDYMPNVDWNRGDPYNFDPDRHWIKVYRGDPTDVRYTGKFDPDLTKLYQECEKQGISILVVNCTDSNRY